MKPVVLVLSTPRCATQWLTAALNAAYPDLLLAEHETIGTAYRPNRHYLRRGTTEEQLSIPEVRSHLQRIGDLSGTRLFLEVSWAAYSAVPLFVRAFPQRLRILHLVRHPVSAALSLVSHHWYEGEAGPTKASYWGELGPDQPQIFCKGFAPRWSQMDAYERCLFYWTEINSHALALRREQEGVAQHTLRYEDIFKEGNDGLKTLTGFLGLPWRDALAAARGEVVDHFRYSAKRRYDWRKIMRHPETLSLAQTLGYAFDGIEGDKIFDRFFKDSFQRRSRNLQRICERVVGPGSGCIMIDRENFPWAEGFAHALVEHKGIDWGVPADDIVALDSLNRHRASGIRTLVCPWTGFWWLDHYPAFRRVLESDYEVLYRDGDVIVFGLKEGL